MTLRPSKSRATGTANEPPHAQASATRRVAEPGPLTSSTRTTVSIQRHARHAGHSTERSPQPDGGTRPPTRIHLLRRNPAVMDAGPFKDHRAPGMGPDPLVGDLHFVRQ